MRNRLASWLHHLAFRVERPGPDGVPLEFVSEENWLWLPGGNEDRAIADEPWMSWLQPPTG